MRRGRRREEEALGAGGAPASASDSEDDSGSEESGSDEDSESEEEEEEEAPEAAAAAAGEDSDAEAEDGSGGEEPLPSTFDDAALGLDARLSRALRKRGLTAPTLVQARVVPLALQGRDVVCRARTGSGKTLAYLLPMMHKILQAGGADGGTQGLVLVPSRDLTAQVKTEANALAEHCGGSISVAALTAGLSAAAVRSLLAARPALLVATPGRLAAAVREGSVPRAALAALKTLVLDEADLLLSYGYEEDITLLADAVSRSCQCLLVSATTSPDVDRLKKLVLHSPVTLTLVEPGAAGAGGVAEEVSHSVVSLATTHDRLLYTLALLRTGAVHRKVLLFVNTVDAGFRLKLFLEAFGVRAALLNSELPQASRQHILHAFNRGLFDYLIATDDGKHADQVAAAAAAAAADKMRGKGSKGGKKGKGGRGARNRDTEEFGVVRGIDFVGVRTVINVEMAPSAAAYVHRSGRTGRAGRSGACLSLVAPADVARRREIEAALGMGARAGASAEEMAPFEGLSKELVEGLRYRAEDVARAVTRTHVREARVKELRAELLNSEKLKAHFEDNPVELEALRHDKQLAKRAAPQHLRHLPAYIKGDASVSATGRRAGGGGKRRAAGGAGKGGGGANKRARGADPLKKVPTSQAAAQAVVARAAASRDLRGGDVEAPAMIAQAAVRKNMSDGVSIAEMWRNKARRKERRGGGGGGRRGGSKR
eukprot:PRCOL_00005286-RA